MRHHRSHPRLRQPSQPLSPNLLPQPPQLARRQRQLCRKLRQLVPPIIKPSQALLQPTMHHLPKQQQNPRPLLLLLLSASPATRSSRTFSSRSNSSRCSSSRNQRHRSFRKNLLQLLRLRQQRHSRRRPQSQRSVTILPSQSQRPVNQLLRRLQNQRLANWP